MLYYVKRGMGKVGRDSVQGIKENQWINCCINGKPSYCGECIPAGSQGYGDRGVCGTIKEKIYELELADRFFEFRRVAAGALSIRCRIVVPLWLGAHLLDTGERWFRYWEPATGKCGRL